MSWGKHRHYWAALTGVNKVMEAEDSTKAAGGLFLEKCYCGAIRQIEFGPGRAPVITVTEKPKDN